MLLIMEIMVKIDPNSGNEDMDYLKIVKNIINDTKTGFNIFNKYHLDFRFPKNIIVDTFQNVEKLYYDWFNSLPKVPSINDIIRLQLENNFSFDTLINSSNAIINENALGWYDHNNDTIVLIIDKIIESSKQLAKKLDIEFNEDFFNRYFKYHYYHELIHSTLDYDFNERNHFRHFTESYANWFASNFLPNDLLSKLIVGANIFEQPKEYGYNLLLNAIDDISKEKLFKFRIDKNHKRSVEFYYRNIIGYDFYQLKDDELVVITNNVERLCGYRNIFCIGIERIEFITNVSGLLFINEIGSLFGITPPGSFIISNKIENMNLQKEIRYNQNCYEIPQRKFNIKEFFLSNKISEKNLRRCYNKMNYQYKQGNLNEDKVIDITIDTLSNNEEPNIFQELRPIFHNEFERIICNKCGNEIEFPYKEGNIIVTERCQFWGDLGKDTYLIPTEKRVDGCPHLNRTKEMKVTCICGEIIFQLNNIRKDVKFNS